MLRCTMAEQGKLPKRARGRTAWSAALGITLLLGALACQRRWLPELRRSAAEARQPASTAALLRTPRAPESSARFPSYPGCEPHPLPACDVRDPPCQSQLFALVACMYGASGARLPSVEFVAPNVMRDEMRAHREDEAGLRAPLEHAATVLGLMLPRVRPRLDDADSGPSAYYSPDLRSVLFVERETTSTTREHALLTLGHELVHALQDRDSALRSMRAARASRTFDQELALFAAIEGEATLYEEILRALRRGKSVREWIPPRLIARTAASDADGGRYSRLLDSAFLSFPYAYGAHWAMLEWLAHGSFHPDARALEGTSTRSVMAKRYGWPELPARCSEAARGSPFPGQVLRQRNSLGAWMIQALVRKASGDVELSRQAARESAGDELAVYSKGPGAAFSFVWTTCWQSETFAQRMERVVAERLGASPGIRFATTRRGHDVLLRVVDSGLAPEAQEETTN
jgi:hypothetical protein